MFLHTLVTLSDNDKRLIFSLLLVVIIILAFISFLGYALFRLLKWQGKKTDTLIHDVVVYKVITDKKHLIRYGRKKNWTLFFKQVYIPFIILLVGGIVLFIHNSLTNNWAYNIFSTTDGFGTLFWTWRATGEMTGAQFDLIRFQKIVVDNTPHLVREAWAGYIVGLCILVGGTWYLVISSCLLARTFYLYKRSKEVFEKSLEGYRQSDNPIPPTVDDKKEEEKPSN